MRNAKDFLAHDFFVVALEVDPGSLEFLFESGERYSSFLRIQWQQTTVCVHTYAHALWIWQNIPFTL